MNNCIGCEKATIVPIDEVTKDTLVKQATSKKCLFEVNFKDENEVMAQPKGLPAIARDRDTICKSLLVKSLKVVHEDVFLNRKRTKFSIMVRLAECFNENIDDQDEGQDSIEDE